MRVLIVIGAALILSGCSWQPNSADENAKSVKLSEENREIGEEAGVEDEETDMEEGVYTMDDVAKHTTREDCWAAVDDTVVDVTEFFGKHPGGDDNLAKSCGKDATEMFSAIEKHDPNGYEALKKFSIGIIEE